MSDNQNNGSSSSQSGGQPKTQLSWGQPSSQNAVSPRPAAQPTAAATAAQPSSRLVGVFVAGLIIGLLVAWAWFDLRTTSTSDTSAMATSTDQFAITQTSANTQGASAATTANSGAASSSSGSMASGAGATQAGSAGVAMSGATISVPQSQAAGYSVQVSSITASGPVWAVVYGDASQTEILGAGRFGTARSGAIDLLRATVPGHTYWVGLVTDTASHAWGSQTDHSPVLGDNGSQAMAQFTAQ